MFPPHCQKCFAEAQIVRVVLPLGEDSLALNARVSLGEFPLVEGFFPPHKLPLTQLEPGRICFIHCTSPAGAFTISARIAEILDPRRLRLDFVDSSPPVQQRQHFRVETQILLHFWPVGSPRPLVDGKSRRVNLSAGGLRFAVDEPVDAGCEYAFAIELPGLAQTIFCDARLVRMLNILDEEHAAFQFTRIQPEDREHVTRFCLAEQRRLLREKVHVRQGP